MAFENHGQPSASCCRKLRHKRFQQIRAKLSSLLSIFLLILRLGRQFEPSNIQNAYGGGSGSVVRDPLSEGMQVGGAAMKHTSVRLLHIEY